MRTVGLGVHFIHGCQKVCLTAASAPQRRHNEITRESTDLLFIGEVHTTTAAATCPVTSCQNYLSINSRQFRAVCGMDPVMIEQYQVPDNCVGLIIGRGGESITAIQNDSGCRIQMSQCSSNLWHHIKIILVKKAKSLMESIITKAGESLPPSRSAVLNSAAGQGQNFSSGTSTVVLGPSLGAKMVTAEMLIPGSKCGLVIGKGGETIKGIQERAGVKMVMIQENNQVSTIPKPLRIIGESEKVEYAKRLVEEIMNSKDDKVPMYNEYGTMTGNKSIGEVIVPKSAVGVIIGKSGEAIKRLTQDTGAKIQFKLGGPFTQDFNAPERTAVITGTREQIEKATQIITDMVKRATVCS
ncbi:unnamed protein product [Soboliphyme baturini]|uniref:KH domain-containing protein n=1 Tax=Soboliphyme baturini TaxID=241478 RepID=A0A183IRZ6_9BILA|nr:unnamed protein product [Soboliphyme baturini]